MIRRVVAPVAIAAIFASGCWGRIEVNDLAIVSMVGINRTADGEMEVLTNVVIPGRAGRGGEQGDTQAGGLSFVMLRGTGRTVMEAAKRIQMELPRRLFWAHARVILIGEELARDGVRPAIDFLTRHRELRMTNYVVVAKDGLTKVMANQTDLEQLPVEYIREISRSHIGTAVTVADWVRDLAAPGAEPIMGTVMLSPPPPGAPPAQSAAPKLVGTALFKGDKLVGYLDASATRGLLWLRAQMQIGTATVIVPKATGPTSIEWARSQVERTARLERGKVTIYVKAKVEGDVNEEQAKLDLSDPQTISLIETEFRKVIKQRMESALAKLRAAKTDAAGFGEVVHRQLPAVWKQVKRDWGTTGFDQVKVVIEVDARVRRTGLSSKPKGLNDEELFKGGS